MISEVKVSAKCDDSREVRVDVAGDPEAVGTILKNGEDTTIHLYGNRFIAVREFKKRD